MEEPCRRIYNKLIQYIACIFLDGGKVNLVFRDVDSPISAPLASCLAERLRSPVRPATPRQASGLQARAAAVRPLEWPGQAMGRAGADKNRAGAGTRVPGKECMVGSLLLVFFKVQALVLIEKKLCYRKLTIPF